MIINIYGVPSNHVIKWIIFFFFKKKLNNWVDLGCGNGEYLFLIGVIPKRGIAVDISEKIPSLPKNFIFKNQNILEWLENSNQEYTLLTMFDVVEHFSKKEAFDLINKAKNLSTNLIISTPSGFMKQDAETHPEEKDNPWQWHKCGFGSEGFEELNFLVFALKNYHYKPPGNNKTFDKLVCFWSADSSHYNSLARSVRIKNLIYILWPLHFYRMIRDVVIRPLF